MTARDAVEACEAIVLPILLRTREPMRPRDGRRFRKESRYPHLRSEGMTSRRNGGSPLQPETPTPAASSHRGTTRPAGGQIE